MDHVLENVKQRYGEDAVIGGIEKYYECPFVHLLIVRMDEVLAYEEELRDCTFVRVKNIWVEFSTEPTTLTKMWHIYQSLFDRYCLRVFDKDDRTWKELDQYTLESMRVWFMQESISRKQLNCWFTEIGKINFL